MESTQRWSLYARGSRVMYSFGSLIKEKIKSEGFIPPLFRQKRKREEDRFRKGDICRQKNENMSYVLPFGACMRANGVKTRTNSTSGWYQLHILCLPQVLDESGRRRFWDVLRVLLTCFWMLGMKCHLSAVNSKTEDLLLTSRSMSYVLITGSTKLTTVTVDA